MLEILIWLVFDRYGCHIMYYKEETITKIHHIAESGTRNYSFYRSLPLIKSNEFRICKLFHLIHLGEASTQNHKKNENF
jgi:hypothetical protein